MNSDNSNKIKKQEFLFIVATLIFSGAIIGLYVNFIQNKLTSYNEQEALNEAALVCIEELANLSIFNPRFGQIGICDQLNEHGELKQISIDSLFSTLSIHKKLAVENSLFFMQKCIDSDFNELNKTNQELAHLQQIAVSAEQERKNSPRLLNIARKYLDKKYLKLKELHLSLGKLKNNIQNKTPDQETKSRAKNNISTLSNSTKLISAEQFESISPNELANSIRLDASFEIESQEGNRRISEIRKLHSCSFIDQTNIKHPRTIFMISFPHGIIDKFRRLKDLITYNSWQSSSKYLRFNINSNHNISPQNPSEAVELGLYHWLLSLGNELAPQNFKLLLNKPFEFLELQKFSPSNKNPDFNTALFKKNKQAEFFLTNQFSEKNSYGQELLKKAFENISLKEQIPESSFPLVIDSGGYCNLPNKQGFNSKLLKDFLSDLYSSNKAAMENMETAQTLIENSSNKTPIEKVKLAWQNAKDQAKTTYQIALHMQAYTKNGLEYVNGARQAYLLSKSVIFIPHNETLSEKDFVKTTKDKDCKTSAWLDPNFKVLDLPDSQDMVERMPIMKFLQEKNYANCSSPSYILLNSGDLLLDKKPKIYYLKESPFPHEELSFNESYLYSAHSLETGDCPKILWSILLRDLRNNSLSKHKKKSTSNNPRWCYEIGMQEEICPCLSFEFQIRSPLVQFTKTLTGYYVQDPDSDNLIQLQAPIPTELL